MIYLSKSRSATIRIIALCIVLALVVPVPINAAESDSIMPLASYYLDAYSAYVYVTANGQVQVWFDVMGTDTMDEIGTLTIKLYESSDGTNWTRVETFLHDSTSGMLFYGDDYISSHVSWSGGSTSKQYKAYVCVWAGKNGTGDTRYFWAYEP